ncbi:hypothetical protein ACJBUB_11095, partial [Streptococcus suis]
GTEELVVESVVTVVVLVVSLAETCTGAVVPNSATNNKAKQSNFLWFIIGPSVTIILYLFIYRKPFP